ncbi:rhodanese-like domain-containing protein [Halocatena salina]|uniref:Rhodanese-like domain-containing protein n=1 Tax=Halocatena salina TaxID=2934340 RepID=A0A8U0A7F9_9EURY|nr:rhodanese-like domain-containing protein [Halocatena salina]UPM45120.1 rhodanese-like domain-containing protein [Halocatena salina]
MIEKISPKTVRKRLERGEDFDLIDIRDRESYTDGHLPDAKHLTVESLENTVADRDWADEVIIYCYVGQTSTQAARLVTRYGNTRDVKSMAGGYEAWESAVLSNTD